MSPLELAYTDLYDSLSGLRQKLHSTGRLDDANAKLDELVKILAICLSSAREWVARDSVSKILEMGQEDPNIVKNIKRLFKSVTQLKQFKNTDGTSIFGANPSINIQDTEQEFAYALLASVNKAFVTTITTNKNGHPFDLLNESFGHFIRDNFRNNIEDAQYMTPPEVVDFICQWALNDILHDDSNALKNQFIVMDPSCGVGSFLASFYSQAIKTNSDYRSTISLIGQDKVDRMVRLSKINMMLFESHDFQIECGNSLIGNQFLNKLNGKVDLIITNPPFNAKFETKKIAQEPKINYPLLNDVDTLANRVDSELLFIDREMSMLKEGGRLFVVLPDSSISARGLPSTLRERLTKTAEIKGLVELPAVTFAQAGTRTKTVILYLQKKKNPTHTGTSVIASVDSLGFEVSLRKGVTVKKYQGENELTKIVKVIKNNQSDKRKILSESPSCVIELEKNIINNAWTPSHYNAKRFKAELEITALDGYEVKNLDELVNFETKKRRRLKEEDGSKCISVLHIIGDGFINISELMTYSPKTKGNVCYPGDILFSKINPRIPRVLVVPDFDFPLTCSAEFEIMTVKEGVSPYWISYILQEPALQDQLRSLTSGTSSSHNRIKTNDLSKVKIPLPMTDTTQKKMDGVIKKYEKSISNLIKSTFEIYKLRHM